MYQDDSSDGGLHIPSPSAPPFDFAVSAQGSSSVSAATGAQVLPLDTVIDIGAIDDFDHESVENKAAHVSVRHDGAAKHLRYRPRMRDVLFASAVGTSDGRKEYRRTPANEADRPKATPSRVEEDIKHLHEQSDRLKEENDVLAEKVAEVRKEDKTGVDTLNTVKSALETLLDGRSEADIVEELEYRNLRPARGADAATLQAERRELIDGFSGVQEAVQSHTPSQDAFSVKDILKDRTQIPPSKPSIGIRLFNALDVTTPQGSRNWAIAFLTTGAVLVALLVTTAL